MSARFPVQRHHKIVGYHYWIKQLTCVDTPKDFPLFGLLQIVPLGLKTGMTHKNITFKPLIAQKFYSKSGVVRVGPRRVVFACQSSSRSLSRSDLGQTWKMKISFWRFFYWVPHLTTNSEVLITHKTNIRCHSRKLIIHHLKQIRDFNYMSEVERIFI